MGNHFMMESSRICQKVLEIPENSENFQESSGDFSGKFWKVQEGSRNC